MTAVRFAPYSTTTRKVVTIALIAFCAFLFIGLAEAHCSEIATPTALYFSLSAADLGSTALALHNPGVSEGNRFMAGHRIEKQLALAGLLTLMDVRLQKSGHQKGLRIAVTVIRFAAIAVNVHNAGRVK